MSPGSPHPGGEMVRGHPTPATRNPEMWGQTPKPGGGGAGSLAQGVTEHLQADGPSGLRGAPCPSLGSTLL